MNVEKTISTKKVYECPIFWVEEAEVELPNGSIAKRWYVVRHDAVLVICIRNESIIFLREFRSASKSVEWRLPSGGVKDGEEPLSAAIRETREEIGLEPLDIKLLKTFDNPSSTIKQKAHCFIATQFKENPLDTGEPEEKFNETKELTFDEARALLNDGEFSASIEKALRVFFKQQ